MTKEQAISILKYNSNVIHQIINGETDPNEVEALDMAIKALEQQPSEDCVSRQEINELFDSEIKMYEERIETRKGSSYHDETERIKEFRSRIANAEYWQNKIKALPPVTHTHKVGYWDKTGGSFRCSECMHMPEFRDIRTLKYCPNCGNPMKWERNNE